MGACRARRASGGAETISPLLQSLKTRDLELICVCVCVCVCVVWCVSTYVCLCCDVMLYVCVCVGVCVCVVEDPQPGGDWVPEVM